MDQCDKSVIVFGKGKTGQAVSKFLTERGAFVRCIDDQMDRETGEVALCGKYDYAVVSPGIPESHPALKSMRENGVPILSEYDLAYIHSKSKRIFAISGTNGKTTTCTILASLLSEVGRTHLVGNIGVPWIGEIDSISKGDLIVVEVSSFQIEQSHIFHPHIAALTNVGEDHLDRHLTAERYQEIKLSLLDRADIKVINLGDPHQQGVEGAVTYSTSDPSADYYLAGRTIYHKKRKYIIPFPSRGVAYDLDYLCAFAVASAYRGGIKKSFLTAYDKVEIPHFRFEYIGEIGGAKVYNDSKGTNIDATIFAVSQCRGRIALILGGSEKGEDYHRLFLSLTMDVERIYLTGANAAAIYLTADNYWRSRCIMMTDLRSVVEDFAARPLDVLLFSPASASFDRYRDYRERGMVFNEIAKEYFDNVPLI